MFKGAFGAGMSFPEWIPRASATALERVSTKVGKRTSGTHTPVQQPLVYHTRTTDPHRLVYAALHLLNPFQ